VSSYTTTGTLVAASLGSTATNVWGADPLAIVDNVAVHGTDMWVACYNRGAREVRTSGNFLAFSANKLPGAGTDFDQVRAWQSTAGVRVRSDKGSNTGSGFRVSK